ncbi:MAG: serine/threonine-protein phosphatase [Bacteroidales bacterium]|nr:serine/threonine-protein phosphatase [Bacteroidales bacterium]
MTQVKFKLAAYTDAAGRYNPEAPRSGNEDNMFVNADLGADTDAALFESDKEMILTEYGCLLVVADGMGGMNAGEVASEIAINIVKVAFSKENVPHYAMENSDGREKYLKKVVTLADEAIKKHAKDHPECEGMGSTIVMAWLHGTEASLAWLGDSRIYLYREPDGLKQLSKDHSYVQELVDNGKITAEEAFIHPYNNIITRSLGDTSKKAVADSVSVQMFKGDIFLLNSDGLSGVLHDDEMGQIISANRASMSACRAALWKAAEAAEWHDNVTAVLCEITDGEEPDKENVSETAGPDEKPIDVEEESPAESDRPKRGGMRKWLRAILRVVALIAAVGILCLAAYLVRGCFGQNHDPEQVEEEVSISIKGEE